MTIREVREKINDLEYDYSNSSMTLDELVMYLVSTIIDELTELDEKVDMVIEKQGVANAKV